MRRRVKQQKQKSNRSGNCTSGKAKVSQYIDLRLSSRRQCNITACKLKLTGAPPLMLVDKVVVTNEEVGHIKEEVSPRSPSIERLPSPVPVWARVAFSFVALLLPLLCLLTLIVRFAFRAQTPRVKYAWVSFLSTLLIISGIFTSV